jgi:hypothetical protein
MPKTRHVPYAERLARESVKFGLRMGRSLLKHAPGLLGIGLAGLPLALLGMGAESADDSDEKPRGFDSIDSRGGYMFDETVRPHALAQDDIDKYHHGLL